MKMKNWKDIALRDAKKLIGLKPSGDELADIAAQLAIVLRKEAEEIERTWTFDEIMAEYGKWQFIKQLPEKRHDSVIKVGGKRYMLADLNKLTLGQIVDIEEFYSEGFVENLHRIMAVLYLPAKRTLPLGKLSIGRYEYDEARAEAFLDVDMDFVWSNALFFWAGVQAYMLALRDYSVKQKMEELEKAMTSLREEAERQ